MTDKKLWPWCAVCNKRVDSITYWDDINFDGRVYVARCHGAEEKTVIPDSLIEDTYPEDWKSGVAFQSALITGEVETSQIDDAIGETDG